MPGINCIYVQWNNSTCCVIINPVSLTDKAKNTGTSKCVYAHWVVSETSQSLQNHKNPTLYNNHKIY